MSDWEEDCTAELLAALASPELTTADIVNPNAQDPDIPQIPLDIQLLIYGNGVWREHRLYVKPDSLRGKEKAGFLNSTMEVVLQDYKDPSILPYSPAAVKGMPVKLLNGNGTDVYFKGAVSKVRRKAFQQSQTTYRDLVYWQISFVNEMWLFKRTPIFEIQKDVASEGAMLADLTGRYCPELDLSGINLEVGRPVAHKTIDGTYLFQIYDEVLKANPELSFYLDITQEPSKIYLDTREALEVVLGIELTDANLYNYCRPGDFSLDYNEDDYCNSVRVRYPKLYNKGTVDVDPASNIVYGTGTDWFGNVHPGNRFRIAGSDSSYNIDKNNSSADHSVEEVYLTGDYKEDLATGLNYEIIGDTAEASDQDDTAIEMKAALSGEVGEFAGLREILIVESTPLTDEEAQSIAEARLRQNTYEGEFNTNNVLFPLPNLRAGRTLYCNMELRGIVDRVPIQEIDWWIRAGKLQPRAGREDPRIDYRIDFTNRSLMSVSIFRNLLLANRKSPVRDQSTLQIYKNLTQKYAVGHCVACTEGEDATHEFSLSYQADAYSVDSSDFFATRYPTPLASAQLALDPVDPDDPDSLWFPT